MQHNFKKSTLRSIASDDGNRARVIAMLIAAVSFTAAPSLGQIPQSGLVAYWEAENNAVDSVNGLSGSLLNGAGFAQGIAGQGFALDGVDDVVVVPEPATTNLDGFSQLTLAAWVYQSSAPSVNCVISKYDSRGADGVSYWMSIENGLLRVGIADRISNARADFIVAQGPAVPIQTWKHVAVAWGGDFTATSVQLYIDGQPVPSTFERIGTPIALSDNPTPVNIGRYHSSGGTVESPFGQFSGVIDSAQIYQRALAASELMAIYSIGASPDSDSDGLTDAVEATLGTDPNNPDTDGDGLLDGTEVDMQVATSQGCPDPLNPDSDGDTLSDGAEVTLGTSACDPDTDGDGLSDAVDPTPTDPFVTSGILEEIARNLADYIASRDVGLFDGPNVNAQRGRRNSLATRARNASKAIAQGHTTAAISLLEGILARADGDPNPVDWVAASTERDTIVLFASGLIGLLSL